MKYATHTKLFILFVKVGTVAIPVSALINMLMCDRGGHMDLQCSFIFLGRCTFHSGKAMFQLLLSHNLQCPLLNIHRPPNSCEQQLNDQPLHFLISSFPHLTALEGKSMCSPSAFHTIVGRIEKPLVCANEVQWRPLCFSSRSTGWPLNTTIIQIDLDVYSLFSLIYSH